MDLRLRSHVRHGGRKEREADETDLHGRIRSQRGRWERGRWERGRWERGRWKRGRWERGGKERGS